METLQRSSLKTRFTIAMASALMLVIFSFTSVLAAPVATPYLNRNYGGYSFSINGSHPVGVTAEWNVPQVSCIQDGNKISGTVAVWPGLGGVNRDNKLEQIGTASQCIKGTAKYWVWWEAFDPRQPNNPKYLPQPISFPVAYGDHMKGVVTDEGNGRFILGLIDESQAKPWTFTHEWDDASARAVPQTGEFIVEDKGEGIFPKFNQVTFTDCYW